MAEMGRPATTEEQFQNWLDQMAPFLKLGETLNAAIYDSGLGTHEWVIREKYRLKDEYSRKIDAYRAIPGKLAHNVLSKIVMLVDEKIKQGIPATEDEMKNVRFYAEKSRAAQPYFVNRTETAEAKPIDELLEELEQEETNNDVATEAKKQVVAPQPPVQDQGQNGQVSPVPPQSDATQASN